MTLNNVSCGVHTVVDFYCLLTSVPFLNAQWLISRSPIVFSSIVMYCLLWFPTVSLKDTIQTATIHHTG